MDKETAIADAKRRLLPLFIDIQSWNDPDIKSAETARQHAIALLEHDLPISDIARRNAISILKQKRAAGRHKELNARRDRIIAEVVAAYQEEAGVNQEQASIDITKLLKQLREGHIKYLLSIRCRKDHLNYLKLGQRRILDIARKHQN